MSTDLAPTTAFSTRDIEARFRHEVTSEDGCRVITGARDIPRTTVTALSHAALAGATLLTVLWPRPTGEGGARLRNDPVLVIERIGPWLHRPSSSTSAVRSSQAPAAEKPSPATKSAIADALGWIKEATGLPQDRIAAILQVSRQTVYNWENGAPIAPHNMEHLLAVRDVLGRAASRYTSQQDLLVWLYSPRGADSRTAADLLAAGAIGKARLLAFTTPAPRVKPAASWTRQSMPDRSAVDREPRTEPFRAEPDDEPIPE